MVRSWYAVILVALTWWAPLPAWGEDGIAKSGVLAYRGARQVAHKWSGLKRYLDAVVPGWRFELVPVTLKSAPSRIENGDLDFILTNPGHYTDLEREYSLSVIASRLRQAPDGSYVSGFGSVIFSRKGAGINVLQDVEGRAVAAVDRRAFGGFQIAWREFQDVGVDLLDGRTELVYVGFPMDQVFDLVLGGRADVGIARSGLIETLVRAGRLDLAQVIVLNGTVNYGHPERISSRLYPEWPFAAVAATPLDLRDKVTIALLSAKGLPSGERFGMTDLWSSPVPYQSARVLTAAFNAPAGPTGPMPWVANWTWWIVVAAGMTILAAAGAVVARRRRVVAKQAAEETDEDKISVGGRPITRREREVLKMISDGHSTKEIARALGISPKTVEFHRSNLLRKFGAKTSGQLVSLASSGNS